VRNRILPLAATALAVLGLAATARADTPGTTTAWQHGRFAVDAQGVIGRSDIVLGQPNTQASQALPLGNGSRVPASGRPMGSPRN
jgi:hypothetical protein